MILEWERSWLRSFFYGLDSYFTVGRKLNLFNMLYASLLTNGPAGGLELYFMLEVSDLEDPKFDLEDLFFLSFIKLLIYAIWSSLSF